MYFNLSSSTDSYLSYRLWQSPNETYTRKFGPLNLMGKFNVEDDKLIYRFEINNSESKYLHLYDTRIIYYAFKKIFRKRYNEQLLDIFINKHNYKLVLGELSPYIKIPKKLYHIASELGISIIIENNELVFKAIALIQFNVFFQKVFILLYRLLTIYYGNDIIKLSKKDINSISFKWRKELDHNEVKYLFIPLFKKDVDFVPLFNTLNKDIYIEKDSDIVYNYILSIREKYNINSTLHIGASLLSYYFISDNKNKKIISLDKNNDKVLLLRRTKPEINKKLITNAYYTNLDFMQCNYLFPIVKDYNPYDLLVIEQKIINYERTINIILDFYKPKYIISFIKLNYFDAYLLSNDKTLYLYDLSRYKYKVNSEWDNYVNNFISTHELNQVHNLIYRLLNIGLCNYEIENYDELNFDEVLEIGIKNSRLYQLEVV